MSGSTVRVYTGNGLKAAGLISLANVLGFLLTDGQLPRTAAGSFRKLLVMVALYHALAVVLAPAVYWARSWVTSPAKAGLLGSLLSIPVFIVYVVFLQAEPLSAKAIVFSGGIFAIVVIPLVGLAYWLHQKQQTH